MKQVERSKQSTRRRQLGRSKSMVDTLSSINIDSDVKDLAKFTASERFFGTRFFGFVHTLRWPLIVAFLIALGFGANLAFQIKPPVDVEELFPGNHVITRFMRAMDTKSGPFQASREDGTVHIDVVIGLSSPLLDDSGSSRWDAAVAGEPVVDGTLEGVLMSRQGRQYAPAHRAVCLRSISCVWWCSQRLLVRLLHAQAQLPLQVSVTLLPHPREIIVHALEARLLPTVALFGFCLIYPCWFVTSAWVTCKTMSCYHGFVVGGRGGWTGCW